MFLLLMTTLMILMSDTDLNTHTLPILITKTYKSYFPKIVKA